MRDFIRDHGVAGLMPYLKLLSAETLVMAVAAQWSSVTPEQRATIRVELERRFYTKEERFW